MAHSNSHLLLDLAFKEVVEALTLINFKFRVKLIRIFLTDTYSSAVLPAVDQGLVSGLVSDLEVVFAVTRLVDQVLGLDLQISQL